MGNYNRDDRGGNRGGFSPRGRSSFGDRNGRGSFQSRGRSSFGGGRNFDRRGNDGPREMFKAVCDNCGKECEVPFRPTSGKPVYCSDCFEKMGGRNADRPDRQERPEFRNASKNFDQNKNFSELNAKLDKILRLLESKTESNVASQIVEEIKEIKAPKTKKTFKKVASEK